MSHCIVGSETARAQWLGPTGGHPDCVPGVACFWDGVHDVSDAYDGVCLVGNYNLVSTYNVGASCTTDAECWSPYGLGRCLFASWGLGIGVCGVTGCGLTDGALGLAVGTDTVPVPDPAALCDISRGHSCQPILEDRTGRAESACVQTCSQVADCDVGLACSRRENVCTPLCADDGECRERERCTTTPEHPGRCVPE